MTVSFGPFEFDRSAGLLQRDGVELPLPPRVLAVLDLLVARAGQIVRRQELIDAVWKEAFVTDTSLAEAVSALRQALGDDPQSPRYIQTLHRRGYRFVAPVTVVGVKDGPVAEPGPAGMSRRPSIGGDYLPWGTAIACALVAAVAIWQLEHLRPALPPVVRFAVEPTAGTSFDHRAPSLALSPDGSLLVWSGCARDGCRLYVRHLDKLDAAVIDGTERRQRSLLLS